MAALPAGTVTFCFTDIEGSTQLFKRLGAGYEALLEDHRRLIREATAYHAGVEVKTDGDGCFLAFQHASAAAAAAAEIQRTVGSHPWPPNGEVRVRIGLHSGEAMPSGDDYVSLAVHQAARVGDAGHGGQVLVSADTAALIESGLTDEWGLVDLGEYRLRDFDESGHLYQLTGPGLERRFPPLRTPT